MNSVTILICKCTKHKNMLLQINKRTNNEQICSFSSRIKYELWIFGFWNFGLFGNGVKTNVFSQRGGSKCSTFSQLHCS